MVKGVHSLQSPEGVDAADGGFPGSSQLFQSGNRGFFVLAQNNELLSRVPPPTVGVGEVGDEFIGCLLEHGRLGTGFMILVDEAIDSSLAYVLVYAPLVDNAPQVASFSCPVALLDDPSVHVYEEHGAIGCGLRPQWSEVDVFGAHELSAWGGVPKHRQSVFAVHLGSADQSSDRLGYEEVAVELLGQPVAPVDALPGATGEGVEPTILADSSWSALYVRYGCDRKNRAEVGFRLSRDVEHAVGWGLLKEKGRIFTSSAGVVEPAVIVLGQPPLSSPPRKLFGLELSVDETVANVLVG